MDNSLQRVNEAVAISVRRVLDTTDPSRIDDRGAFGYATGKRIQGTYGARLRQTADANPQMTAVELYQAVIVPEEFPWDAEAVEKAQELLHAGKRDKARPRHYGPFLEDEGWREGVVPAEQPGWSEGLAEVRRRLHAPTEAEKLEAHNVTAQRHAANQASKPAWWGRDSA